MRPARLRLAFVPIRLQLLAAVLAAIAPVLVAFGLAYADLTELLRFQRGTELSGQRLQLADHVLADVFDAESALRGYLLTGDTATLAPFETVARQMPDQLTRLQELAASEALLAPRSARVAELYRGWLTEAATPFVRARALVDDVGPGSADGRRLLELLQRQVALGEGSRFTAEIRWLLNEWSEVERDRLERHLAAGGTTRTRLLAIAAVGIPSALALGTLVALGLARRATRSLSALTAAAQALEAGESPSQIRVVGRDEIGQLARAFNRLTAGEARRRRERESLSELAQLLQASESLAEAARVVETMAPAVLPEATGGVYFFDPSRADLELASAFGPGSGRLPAHFPPSDCWAVRRAQTHRVLDPKMPRCAHVGAEIPTGLCVPLATQGEVFGVLHCVLETPATPSDRDEILATAQTLADQLDLHFAALRLREALRGQSIRDPLTGLFNRRYFEETAEREIRRAERGGTRLALLLADLDHFKRFNDTFGHEAGDLVLREFGSLLVRLFRGGDVACRLGGEEFAVLMPDADFEAVRHRVDELASTLRGRELTHRGRTLGAVTFSAGVAGFPQHGSTVDEILRSADDALFAAKSSGRDRLLVA